MSRSIKEIISALRLLMSVKTARFVWKKRALIVSALLVSVQALSPLGTIAVYAASTVSNDVGSSASLDPVGNKATRLQTQGSSGVDQSSGALTYSYPLSLPEGRGGMSPKLSLSYNSQNNDSGSFGYGWVMSIPYIERTAKTGSDKLYTNPAFVSSLHGELTSSNGISYEQKIDDGSYAKYTYSGSNWQMTDRDGTTYYFGNTYYSRVQDDPGTKIGRWYLTEVRDKFGNGITYTYTKDQGTVYPSTISYTEHAMAHPLNLVSFTLENKNDQLVSYKYGFKTTDTKRVSAIKVSTSGKDNSYFYFGYTTGSNGTRSLLQSVEEKHLGTNDDWTTLPKTTFEYEKSAPSFSGTISNSSNPYGSNSIIDTDNNGILDLYSAGDGYFPIEINGDYKKDLVQAEITYGAYSSGQYINFKYNQGGTFFLRSLVKPQTPAYIRYMVSGNPTPPLRHMGEYEWWWTQESVVTDVNGDGFDDVVYNDRYGSNGVGINTTNNTFDYSTSTNLWFNITNDQLTDVNGDGLQDKISKSTSATTTYSVYLNNGTSYATSTYYVYSTGVSSIFDLGVRFVDVNNDGLVDIARSYTSNYNAIPPCDGFWSPANPRPVNQTVNEVYVNTGTGFTATSTTMPGYFVSYTGCPLNGNTNVQYLTTKEYDTDGDLDTDYDSVTNSTSKQDVLKKVNTSLGSTLDVSYTWTTANGFNPTLPVPMYTVGTTTEKLSSSDTSPHIVSYIFQDGAMYFDETAPRDHKFAGFGKVQVVDGNKKTITYFHQGNGDSYTTGEKDDSYYNIGRAYRTDTFDLSSGSSVLISKDLSLFKTYSYASSSFTYLDSQVQDLYNLDGTYESSGTKNTYDETKRLIKTSYNYGDIEPFISFASSTISDKGSDLTVTAYEYSNSRPQRLVKQTTKDYAGQLIANTSYYYDGLPYGLVDKGAVTSVADTVYKTDGTVNSTSTIQTAYDPTGNAIQTTDNLGNITRMIYDSTYYFPVQKIDALNGTTTYAYDPYTLNLLSTKGPDGITYVKETDGLGKVTRSYTMDTGGGIYDEIKTNYVYGSGISVYSRKMGTSNQNARSLEIYDSYGRLIQSKKETTEDSFLTQDTKYDANSNVTSTSLPYTTSGYGYTTDTPTNGKTVYTYDGLGRVTSKAVFGTTATYSYGARSLTVQDNASTQHKKAYFYNAQGSLAQVKEYNGASVYTTSYTYTPTNKLSRITDASGNIRNFSYLSNGLLSYQEDPHSTTDTTFTTYSYTYDSLGNLITKNGSLGTLTYTYDALNRPLSRTLVDGTYGTSTIALAYTGCSNNYLSPCTINRTTSSTTLSYNASGKLGSESLSIDGKIFTRSYVYDTFGNPTTITYPDGGQTVYTYTLDGKQASLSYITPTGAIKSIVSNSSFNSMGALSSLSLGNGVQMCNTYTTTSADGTVSPKLLKSAYLFNSTGCSLSGSNQIELYKDEFTYKDNLTPSSILSTYKDIAGTTHTKSDTFTYDNLARLTQVSTSYNGGSAVVDTLVYDPIGNIISENDVLYRYSKDGMQNAHAVTSIGGTNISYDSQGNRIQVGDNAYAWNALNQLVIATSTNGTEIYTYDENGERIKKVVQATSVVNQKATPSTSGLAINSLSSGDLLATVATSSTYIATSTYNTLSSLSLLDKPTLLTLSTTYYSSPFTSKFCAATSTANRQSCITETTKHLIANDINQRSTSTVATNGLITDIIKISTGEYLIPSSYVGIATSSIATSDPSVFSINSDTISSYNTYIATGIVVVLDEYNNLPYVSTSTYNALASVGLTDTTKVRAVMTLAGCDSIISACATTKKVIFEKYYKESGYLLSDRALHEMWYVYAAKARLPGNSTELTATSTYLGNITVPTITSRSTSAATTTYYSSLYFNTEYTNQNTLEPRLQHFNTIPYYVTTTAFSELIAAGITQTTIENYQAQINDVLNIRYASSTEYMVALRAFADHDRNVTLSWDTLKELYLVTLGAATIPNDVTEYTESSVYDLASYLTVQTVYGTYSSTLSNTTTGCQGGSFQLGGTGYLGRCKIRVSPFTLPVATSSTVTYKLAVTAPHVTDFILNAGESTSPTYAVDNYNFATQIPIIYSSRYAPATYYSGMLEYTSGTISSNGWTQTIDVTSTIVKQKASSTEPAVILLMNRSGWTSGEQYSYESLNTSVKAYADTPRLTLASTTLVSGVTNATTTSFTAGIESTISIYFGENHDSSFDINTGTTSPMVFISQESALEFASTTLQNAYQLTRVFMATSTSQCAISASTTECDKNLRKSAFREIVTNLSGFTPSQAATEEFWMVYKGILTLPNINYASTTATTTVAGYYQATSTTGAWLVELAPGYYSSTYTATSTASTTITILNTQAGGTTFTAGTGSQYVLAFCGSYCATPLFNGVAMTNLETKASPNTNSDIRVFGIATTTSGSVNVTSDCGTYCGNATDHYRWMSLKGLNTSSYYYDTQSASSNSASSLSVTENIQDKNNLTIVSSNISTTGTSGGTGSSPLVATTTSRLWYHYATTTGNFTYSVTGLGATDAEIASIQMSHDSNDTVIPGYWTSTYVATTTAYYIATSSALLPAIVSSTSTPYPVFSRSNLPSSLATTTTYYTSTTTIPGFWVDQVVYLDRPTGGATSTSGSYTIHTFTATSTFTASSTFSAEVLVVGGGGGGGGWTGGGGGGGQVIATTTTITAQSYAITVGNGGLAGNTYYDTRATNGGSSSFGSTTAIGGGHGGAATPNGSNGGTGGGAGYGSDPGSSTVGQGNGGTAPKASPYTAGGGGGAGGNGANGATGAGTSGNGGIGIASSITGTSTYYGGGGGGAGSDGSHGKGTGGSGGGGNGADYNNSPSVAQAGTANTGGGGGGNYGTNTSGSGGSGIVIVRYLTSLFPSDATTTQRIYIATSTLVQPVTNLNLVPPGLLSSFQFNTLYATSSFALATSTKVVSQDTYNELLRTPIRLNSDVKLVFDYALPYATSTCPGEAATSTCVVGAQKTKVKDTISAMSGFVFSNAALEELYRVKNRELSIVPISMANAATSSVSQTVIVPLITSEAFKTFSTSTATGTTTTSSNVGTCSFGINGATTSLCYINLPYINSPLTALTFKYDVSTSTVSTSTVTTYLSYITQTASTTGATSTPQFTTITSTSTVTGQKSGVTFSFDLGTLYQNFLSLSNPVFTLTPDASGTSTQTYSLSNPTLSITRNIVVPTVAYASSTLFVPFDRSTVPSYSTTTATTTVDLTNAPALELTGTFLSPVGSISTNSSYNTTINVATSSLQAYYKLDESSGNASDASGNGNTLTNTGTVTYSTGKINNGAVGTNTSGGYLTNSGALGFTAASSNTWNFWYKPNNRGGYLFDNITTAGDSKRLIVYEDGAGSNVHLFANGSDVTSSPMTTGVWYMITVTKSGTSWTLYINGVSQGTTSTGGLTYGGGAGFTLLNSLYSGGATTNSSIDEFSVWTRTLSTDDISALYNGGSGRAYPFQTTTLLNGTTTINSGSVIDPIYADLPPTPQSILPSVNYPFATGTIATSTIWSTSISTTTQYTVYSPFGSSYSEDTRGTRTTYFTFNGVLVGAYTYQIGNESSSGKVSYTLSSYIGTPVLETDDKGDIVEMDITDVFGNYVHRDQRVDNALHTKAYTGHEFDDTTSLIYARARYLMTTTHSFLSSDPVIYNLESNNSQDRTRFSSILLNPQAQNSYAYAGNNPIINTDPDGKFWWKEFYTDWGGYDGLDGIGMKAGEVLGGRFAAQDAIAANRQNIANSSAQTGVPVSTYQAIMYEENAHQLPPFNLERTGENIAPNAPIFTGGVGAMQVSSKTSGLSNVALLNDKTNVAAGGALLQTLQATYGNNPSTIGAVYNSGNTTNSHGQSYGQRISSYANTSFSPTVGDRIVRSAAGSITSPITNIYNSVNSAISTVKNIGNTFKSLFK